MSQLTVFLFGPPRIERDGQAVKPGRRKALALFSYLAVTSESHARDTLATLFWPESDQASAGASLRSTLSALKKAIGEGWIEVDRERVSLRRTDGFWLDVDRFRQCLEACRKHAHPQAEACPICMGLLSEAAELYRGELLAGFSLGDSPDFDEWQCFQAEELRRELASILEQLARMYGTCQNFEQAIAHAQRLVELDDLHEPAHRQLMRLYVQSGQPAAALRQYETCVQVLEAELGIPPQADTEQLYQVIQAGHYAPHPPPPPSPYRHNLPYQTTPFVGREEEIVEIGQMIEGASCRLACLVGPGGVGKTRLALEVAAGRKRAFPHGVYFVPLARVSSASYLPAAIADGLSLSLSGPEDPKEQLLNYLRHKELLLVLDNFEHLLEGAGLLSEIMAGAPEIKLLVTSRERLNTQGEWVVEIEGLRFPKQGEGGDAEDGDAEAYSAVQLFAQSARRARANFRLGEEEKRWVARICRWVEGMPLAIEMAASWARALSCAEIAAEIERDLDFLSSPARDVPDRHRSLRATFDHSWGLLSEEEKVIFTKLTVFRGGFDKQAAQAVAHASPVLLARLVDKSFLRWSVWSGRYELHELLRQYAAEQLPPTLEKETRDRHCAYFVAFLGRRERALVGEGQIEALREIGVEIENVRLAWQWAVENGQKDRIEQCLESLFHFYDAGSWFQEGRDVFAKAAAALGQTGEHAEEPDSTLWKLRVRLGTFDHRLGRYQEAKDLIQKGLEVFRAIDGAEDSGAEDSGAEDSGAEDSGAEDSGAEDSGAETAFCLISLAEVAISTGTHAEAAQLLEQALPHAQAAHRVDLEAMIYLRWGGACYRQGEYQAARLNLERSLALAPPASRLRAESLHRLGGLDYYQVKLPTAYAYYEQALRLYRQIGDQLGEATTLVGLGNTSAGLGNFIESVRYYEQALLVRRKIGNRSYESVTMGNLGSLFDQLGDLAIAEQYYEQALCISREIEARGTESWVLCNLGLLYHHMGDDETARKFSQQALHLAREIGDRFCQSYASINLGHSLARLGELAEAAATYRQAIAICRDLDQQGLIAEPLAGLARIALAQEDLPQAKIHVEEILSHLQTGTLDRTAEPQRIYLTCYQVLDACQDARAGEILATAYHLLREQADKIDDEALRRSFLDIAAHREIIRLWMANVGQAQG